MATLIRSTHQRPTLGLLLAAVVLLVACAPTAQPSPTAAPAKPAATTAPAKPAEAKPAPSTGSGQALSKAEGPAASPAAKTEAKPAASPAGKSAAKASVPPGTRLSIATGGTGGVYFPLGGGLANMLQQHLGVTATAEVTPASVDNMKLVNDRRKDLIAFSLADTAYDAAQGRERLKDTGPIQVRSLGIIYTNFMHAVTVEGTGINTISDMKGKRVSVGAAGSGTETKANRVLEAHGIDPGRDIQRERLGAAESAGAQKDRKVDAFFWDGGLPTGAITDLANTPGMTLKMLSHADAVEKMNAKYGKFYTLVAIPKETYKGMTADAQVAGTPNILAVHQEFPEDVAHTVVATIFDNINEWGAIHPEGKNTRLETAWKDNPVPLHPGAIRFYRERGVYQGP
jgi:TRAP transporter TAXI family solute receptor